MASNVLPFPRRNSNDNGTDPNPPQPGLRSFIVYNELPGGCFAFEIEDQQTAPHVREGDFVVVDGTDTTPVAGELFVCAFATANPNEKRLRVMEVSHASFLPGHFMLTEVQPRSVVAVSGGSDHKVKFADGPYPPEYLSNSLFRGKVVGIYEPDFRNQLRRLAA